MRPNVKLLLLPFIACSQSHALTTEQISVSGMSYAVISIDPKKDRLSLHWLDPATKKPYLSFENLRKKLSTQGKTMLFATNSGIYTKGPKPLGLHIENGKTLVGINEAKWGGNFAMLPNGVFWITSSGAAGVSESKSFKRSGIKPNFATQSGPMLVIDGKLHPDFRKASESINLRSGVGVCSGGNIKFVVSSSFVNFYSFAKFFRDTLGCPNALYLDGSISSYADENTSFQWSDFAGMWVVSK